MVGEALDVVLNFAKNNMPKVVEKNEMGFAKEAGLRVFMEEGKITEQNTQNELLSNPKPKSDRLENFLGKIL